MIIDAYEDLAKSSSNPDNIMYTFRLCFPGALAQLGLKDLDRYFKRGRLKWCHQHPEAVDISQRLLFNKSSHHLSDVLTLLGVWCWCMLALHWYFWAPWFRWTVSIVPFYKGVVVTSVGRVSFFKDTHRIWISQKITTSSSWNSKNRPMFVRTF